MLDKLLNVAPILTAQGALDGLSTRHAAIADNIANVNTPGYKRKEAPFEDALSRAVQDTSFDAAHPFATPVVSDTTTEARSDGNNVDVESEMARLAETTLRYQTLTQCVGGFFSGLKAVINAK